VRENPTTVSNVVTYTVITLVDNPQNKLLPGMTANASIGVQTAHNALIVPVAALSFRPTGAFSGKHRSHSSASSPAATSSSPAASSASAASPWGQTSAAGGTSVAAGGRGIIFVDQNGKASPVPVHIDLISGTQAAVTPLRGTLVAGDAAIVSSGTSSDGRSPAAPSHSSAQTGPGMSNIGRALR
jgi:HlyD family secretion protein